MSFLLLVIIVPIGVYFIRQEQDTRSKAAPATILSFSPVTTSKGVGDTFTVDVAIDTGCSTGSAVGATCNQITTADLVITYDPALVDATSITLGSFLSGANQLRNIIDPATGKIKYGVNVNPAGAQSGQGTLARITFVGKKAGSFSLQFDPATLLTGSTEDVNVVKNQSSGTITITGLSPTSTPTPTTTSATTSTPTPTQPAGAAATPTPTNRPNATPTPTPTSSGGTGGSTVTTLTVSRPRSGEVVTTSKPTFKGTAPAQSTITITIESTNPITENVIADANGNWSYTPSAPLADGTHTLTVNMRTPSGSTSTVTRSFNVSTGSIPVSGNETPTLLVLSLGLGILVLGLRMGFVK